jgi:hypothetical protein
MAAPATTGVSDEQQVLLSTLPPSRGPEAACFEDFQLGSWRSPSGRSVFDVQPFWRGEIGWGKAPAVDIVDKENAYEITAELSGMDESNIHVKFADGTLTITGEKQEEKAEKNKEYYLSERRYVLSTLVRGAGRRRCRQDRGELQERGGHGHTAENAASTEERKKIAIKKACVRLVDSVETRAGKAASYLGFATRLGRRQLGGGHFFTSGSRIVCQLRCVVMPYRSNSDLPAPVRSHLPPHAQDPRGLQSCLRGPCR